MKRTYQEQIEDIRKLLTDPANHYEEQKGSAICIYFEWLDDVKQETTTGEQMLQEMLEYLDLSDARTHKAIFGRNGNTSAIGGGGQ